MRCLWPYGAIGVIIALSLASIVSDWTECPSYSQCCYCLAAGKALAAPMINLSFEPLALQRRSFTWRRSSRTQHYPGKGPQSRGRAGHNSMHRPHVSTNIRKHHFVSYRLLCAFLPLSPGIRWCACLRSHYWLLAALLRFCSLHSLFLARIRDVKMLALTTSSLSEVALPA